MLWGWVFIVKYIMVLGHQGSERNRDDKRDMSTLPGGLWWFLCVCPRPVRTHGISESPCLYINRFEIEYKVFCLAK